MAEPSWPTFEDHVTVDYFPSCNNSRLTARIDDCDNQPSPKARCTVDNATILDHQSQCWNRDEAYVAQPHLFPRDQATVVGQASIGSCRVLTFITTSSLLFLPIHAPHLRAVGCQHMFPASCQTFSAPTLSQLRPSFVLTARSDPAQTSRSSLLCNL